MDRRKALATAAAITMSLTSGAIAIGANTGALGFGGAPAVAAAPQNAPTAAPAAPRATVRSEAGEREQDDGARAPKSNADTAAQPKGENDA